MTQKWCWQMKSQNMQDFSKGEINRYIEQAHQVTTANRNSLPHQHHLFLLPKLQIGTCQKKSNLPLLKLTRKEVSRQYLSRRCTPTVQVSDRKKNCGFEVPSRSQRPRPINPRLCKTPSHTKND